MSIESRRRKKQAAFIEGAAAAGQFGTAITAILSVSKEEIERREAAYQEARANKDRPGPRPTRQRHHGSA